MQSNQLQKAIDLAKKTGDRLIVFDKAESGDPFVVMSMDEYEKLVIGHSEVRGLTENELLDKINRDIAVWKSDNEFSDFDEGITPQTPLYNGGRDGFDADIDNVNIDFSDFENLEDEDDEIEDIYKDDFSSPGLKEMQKSFSKKSNITRNNWSIPSERKQSAEEIEGEDEDRQYLEELPF